MKQTVTIGDTTLVIDRIEGWALEESWSSKVTGPPFTSVMLIGRSDYVSVDGDHREALDAAVNDPARQNGCSLVQHGGK